MSIDNAGVSFAAKWEATADAANAVMQSVCDRVNSGENVSITVTLSGAVLVRILGALNRDCESDMAAIALASSFGDSALVSEGAHHLFNMLDCVDTLVSQAQDVPDTLPDSWA